MKESALGVSITMIHIVPKVTNAYMWPSLSNWIAVSFLVYVLVSHKSQFAHVIFIIHSLTVLIQVVSGDQDLKALQFYAKEDIMWTVHVQLQSPKACEQSKSASVRARVIKNAFGGIWCAKLR